MMTKKICNWLAFPAALLLTSCIKNDIPYPYIEGVIQAMEVYDMQGAPKIDAQRHVVELTVGDKAFLDSLPITKLVANAESEIIPDSSVCINPSQFPNFSFTSLNDLPANANTAIDFTKPVKILLRTYQDYIWSLVVKQEINRVVDVAYQVGDPQINANDHMAIIYIEKDRSLSEVKINKLELEGPSATVHPDPSSVTDFTRPRKFKFYREGRFVSEWFVDVQPTIQASFMGDVNAWARKAELTGSVRAGAEPVIEYREEGATDWSTMPSDALVMNSTTAFTATLTGLKDGTTYEWRIVVDGQPGASASFQTEKIETIPNLNFDTWTQNGKNWYPNEVPNNFDAVGAFWASGNEGVTSNLAGGHEATTEPVSGAEAYKGKAAKMHSLTGVTLVGSAAGNLFVGSYKTNMSNPSKSVSFGRPYTGARPTKMVGYYKYMPKPITNGTKPGTLKTDQCHIYMKLWDANGFLFGYGEFVGSEQVDEYTRFEFDITYTDKKAKPASMSIVATSSRYGGDFEGAKVVGQVGHGSTLWVDEFEVIYD